MQVRSGHISTSGRPSGEEHWSLSSAGLVEEKRAKTTVQTVFTHFLIVPFYFVLNTVFCNGLLFHFTGLWILPPGARGIFSKGGGPRLAAVVHHRLDRRPERHRLYFWNSHCLQCFLRYHLTWMVLFRA